jgi:hypothetical protein
MAALFVGCLRMTPEEAIEELAMIAHAAFPNKPPELTTPTTNLSNLRRAVGNMLERRGMPTDIGLNVRVPNAKCKFNVHSLQ